MTLAEALRLMADRVESVQREGVMVTSVTVTKNSPYPEVQWAFTMPQPLDKIRAEDIRRQMDEDFGDAIRGGEPQ